MSGATISIIINVLLFLVIIGLIIWIILLYRKPPCVANATLCNSFCKSNCSSLCPSGSCTPSAALCNSFCQSNCSNLCPQQPSTPLVSFVIFGTTPAPCVTRTTNTIKGIMIQDNTSLRLVPTSNTNNSSAHWYFIPTKASSNIIIQNVGSGGYINVNPTNSAITVQSGISNATSFQWQISTGSNINYLVYVSPTANGCPNNAQYITFQADNSIKMSCVQAGVSGQWWYTSPTNSGLVG